MGVYIEWEDGKMTRWDEENSWSGGSGFIINGVSMKIQYTGTIGHVVDRWYHGMMSSLLIENWKWWEIILKEQNTKV